MLEEVVIKKVHSDGGNDVRSRPNKLMNKQVEKTNKSSASLDKERKQSHHGSR